jgi:hypothetical protein
MCIANAGLMMQGAGTGLQAGAAYQAASAQNLANKFNATMNERNAELTELKAKDALKTGQQQLAEWTKGVRSLRGEQKAAAAASGVSVYSGSMIDTEARTQLKGAIGAQRIMENADKQAWALRMQAAMFQSEARMSRARKVSPGLAMAGPMLYGLGGMTNSFQSAMGEWSEWMNPKTVPSVSNYKAGGYGGVDSIPGNSSWEIA